MDKGSQEKAEVRSGGYEEAQGTATPLRTLGEIHQNIAGGTIYESSFA